jgi:hypothetical protein
VDHVAWARVPCSAHELSALQTTATGFLRRGDQRGRVHDVVATRRAGSDDPWELHCLLIGRHALLPRIGFSPSATTAIYEGQMPADVARWSDVERLGENGSLVVRR